MSAGGSQLPRVRQVVLATRELEAVADRLRAGLGLGEPFRDPGVEYFGLRNVVFAFGDTFLEVVSPVREDTAAGRLLDRRGGDSGYMVMFQVDELETARTRAARAGVREVFEVALDDIAEVHLHPADMRGAIVSLSEPRPPRSWRWGGPDWEQRSVPGAIAGIRIGVRDPETVAARWREILGSMPAVEFVADEAERGPVEIVLEAGAEFKPITIGGVRIAALR